MVRNLSAGVFLIHKFFVISDYQNTDVGKKYKAKKHPDSTKIYTDTSNWQKFTYIHLKENKC